MAEERLDAAQLAGYSVGRATATSSARQVPLGVSLTCSPTGRWRAGRDVKWGETVKAVVVLHPNAQATERELIDHCRDRLAHYKCLTSIQFDGALSRTATGRVQKFKLRARYWRNHARLVN